MAFGQITEVPEDAATLDLASTKKEVLDFLDEFEIQIRPYLLDRETFDGVQRLVAGGNLSAAWQYVNDMIAELERKPQESADVIAKLSKLQELEGKIRPTIIP